MSDIVLYILIPTDMPSLGRGKAAAHAAHAANLFTYQHYVRPLKRKETVDQALEIWHESADGFGTTIALDVKDRETMTAIVDHAKITGFKAGVVIDPTYPYFIDTELVPLIDAKIHTMDPIQQGTKTLCFRKEKTCAYVFGDKKELALVLQQFNLLPND